MSIVILDDYQDAVRKLACAVKLKEYPAKVYTNTVKGLGQLAVRLRDADVVVLIRQRTQITRALIEKLPNLRLIAQTGHAGTHIDLAACTEHGVAVTEGVGSPIAPAELTWALIMAAARRLPQYIGNLKHGAWQHSGLKSATMPPNFGLGMVLRGRQLGIWGYGRIGRIVAGYGRAFGMQVVVWGSQKSMEAARADGFEAAPTRSEFFALSDVLSLHLRLTDATRQIVTFDDLARMKPTALFVNISRAELLEPNALITALKGRILGIWGYGRIGQIVAGYGRAFGMQVVVWGSPESMARARADGLHTAPSRAEFFALADVLSLHLRLADSTRGLIKLEDLGRMKPSALLVNTSRAELIEPDALLAGLNRGRPGMAAVDVFESEPILQGHALLRLENCICTPHIGYVELQSYEMYFNAAFDNVLNFIKGTPTNIVNPGSLQVRR